MGVAGGKDVRAESCGAGLEAERAGRVKALRWERAGAGESKCDASPGLGQRREDDSGDRVGEVDRSRPHLGAAGVPF